MQARTWSDRRLGHPFWMLVGMVVGMGCWKRAEHHCSNLEGDATCAERGGGRFCDLCRAEGDGCTNARPSEACHFAGQAGTSAGTIDDGAVSHGEEATAEASGPTTTGGGACRSDDDCEGSVSPFCASNGACVACDQLPDADAACASRDEAMPVCVGGECVQCSEESSSECDALLQICDAETHACTSCVEHEQCESGACELAVGRCFPPDVVVFEVDGDGAADYSSVGAAVAAIADGEMGIVRIHELDGTASYLGAPVIDGGKTVALLAAVGEAPVLRGAFAGTSALRVEGADTTVYIDRISLRGTDGRGLVVSDGTAWVDRSRIVQNTGGGVLAEAGASITIRSSFVGGTVSDVAVVEVTGATASILYATLGGGFGNARALACNATATVEVRNSVLVARTGGPEIQCDATFEHDAAEHDLGGTNTEVPPMSPMWFEGYTQGDFRLSHEGAEVFADVARWQEGDPRVDIDGDERPSGADGVSDHAGADVP